MGNFRENHWNFAIIYLVGGFKHFHDIWDVIPPIDELIFVKMVSLPPSSYRCDVQLSTIGGSWVCLIFPTGVIV